MDFMHKTNKPVTTAEISRALGVSLVTVSALFSRCAKYKYGYFKRLRKVDTTGARWCYRYSLTKKGLNAYAAYLVRYQQGRRLNLHEVGDMRPIQMGSYIGFTKAGKANPPSIKEVSEKFHIPPGAFFLNARKGNSKR